MATSKLTFDDAYVIQTFAFQIILTQTYFMINN